MPPITLKIIKVFIGSPGGLEAERQLAKRIVDETNQCHAEHWGCQLHLVGWEATLPGYIRAQSQINQDLDKCDYFVGILWNSWGSRPTAGPGEYTSGFEEEYERARTNIAAGTMKDIALYFKEVPAAQLNDPGASLKQVLAFKKKCEEDRQPLFKLFKEPVEFESVFRATIVNIGWRESELNRPSGIVPVDLQQPASEAATKPSASDGSDRLIGLSAAAFVSDLLTRSAEWDATTNFEVARLRLIAAALSRAGNDEIQLGNHDANIIFAQREGVAFNDGEIRHLIETGVAGFEHQNVPLWYWIRPDQTQVDGSGYIAFLSLLSEPAIRVNAIRIIQRLGKFTPRELLPDGQLLKRWLTGDASQPAVKAALSFLKTNGTEADAEELSELLAEVNEHSRSDAAGAIVHILAKVDLAAAFDRLIELNPEPLDATTAALIFSHPSSIPTGTLQRALELKSDVVRKRSAELLYERRAIDADAAGRLMSDPSREIRLIALASLSLTGSLPDDGVIRQALIVPRQSNLLSYLGSQSGAEDRYYEQFRRGRLAELGYGELTQLVEQSGVFNRTEVSVLNENFFRKRLSAIQHDLSDEFESYFAKRFERLAALTGIDSQTIVRTRDLSGYLRRGLTTEALGTLCTNSGRSELSLVRKVVDAGNIEFCGPAVTYLGKYGDWSDAQRICSLDEKSSSFLNIGRDEHSLLVGRALYSISRSRLVDGLKLEVGSQVKHAIIRAMTVKEVAGLSDDVVIRELSSKSDAHRKLFALRFIHASTQARTRAIATRYLQQPEHFYNTVHWLDLGASMPRDVVRSVANFELSNLD